MRKSTGERVFNVTNYIFLTILSFVFLFPFWRIIMVSLNQGLDAGLGGIYFWPRKFTLDNYIVIFSRPEILSAYKVTIARTVIGTAVSVFFVSLMAYGLSKKHLKGRRVINVMVLITMYFSGGLIPFYLLLRGLALTDKFWVYIIPCIYQAWYIILFRTFFQGLPESLEESAKLDGANDLTIFFRIIVPISLPVFASMALFTAVNHWNDWYMGTVFVQNSKLVPLQTLLMKIIRENEQQAGALQQGSMSLSVERMSTVTPYSIKMGTLVVTVLPIMIVYPFLQKYFVKGIMIGSVKG